MSDPSLHIVPTAANPAAEVAQSFSDFFEREKVPLFRSLCLVTRNPAEAEELTQEAFVRVLERWERVSGLEDPRGYLYRTAFNTFRSWRRRATLAARRTLWSRPSDDRIVEVESQDAVVRALAQLPHRQRAAVVLTDLLGYTSDEAGSVLGIRGATVRSHASRAHAELKRWVATQDE